MMSWALRSQRLDIDAQLAEVDQAARLPELADAFIKVAASWAKRSGISAADARGRRAGPRARQGWPVKRLLVVLIGVLALAPAVARGVVLNRTVLVDESSTEGITDTEHDRLVRACNQSEDYVDPVGCTVFVAELVAGPNKRAWITRNCLASSLKGWRSLGKVAALTLATIPR